MVLRDTLLAAICAYEDSIRYGGVSEKEAGRLLDHAENLAPHSILGGILHHGEKEYSVEEAADEALNRERIWQEGGDLALALYLQGKMLAALDDPATEWLGRRNAKRALAEAETEIARLKGATSS